MGTYWNGNTCLENIYDFNNLYCIHHCSSSGSNPLVMYMVNSLHNWPSLVQHGHYTPCTWCTHENGHSVHCGWSLQLVLVVIVVSGMVKHRYVTEVFLVVGVVLVNVVLLDLQVTLLAMPEITGQEFVNKLSYQQNAWNDVWCLKKCGKACYIRLFKNYK